VIRRVPNRYATRQALSDRQMSSLPSHFIVRTKQTSHGSTNDFFASSLSRTNVNFDAAGKVKALGDWRVYARFKADYWHPEDYRGTGCVT
jgi:hypothetical protein